MFDTSWSVGFDKMYFFSLILKVIVIYNIWL
jgi:hypothetical protein